jgi:hypothetical protein
MNLTHSIIQIELVGITTMGLIIGCIQTLGITIPIIMEILIGVGILIIIIYIIIIFISDILLLVIIGGLGQIGNMVIIIISMDIITLIISTTIIIMDINQTFNTEEEKDHLIIVIDK